MSDASPSNIDLKARLNEIRQRIAAACAAAGRLPGDVRLIAVTKTYPVETAQALIDLGVHDIGENRVQEIEEKVPHLHGEFSMHMIGHLQTNKIRKVVPHAGWIQSVDSIRVLDKINQTCGELEKKINILVEVNTSGEASKSGCLPADAPALCEAASRCRHIVFKGLMTLGPLGGSEREVRNAFALLRNLGERCGAHELSMGMSGDFEWAIAEGATMVRIGTLLLGKRE
ncbi:MAG: YggS family pyridoxal phosphate-dependent enzyme [Chitinivibrionales bacterium]|nr:YggS family pyridoxal phosphate-dependent enzyme [Chitinivibrionales bacterium]